MLVESRLQPSLRNTKRFLPQRHSGGVNFDLGNPNPYPRALFSESADFPLAIRKAGETQRVIHHNELLNPSPPHPSHTHTHTPPPLRIRPPSPLQTNSLPANCPTTIPSTLRSGAFQGSQTTHHDPHPRRHLRLRSVFFVRQFRQNPLRNREGIVKHPSKTRRRCSFGTCRREPSFVA